MIKNLSVGKQKGFYLELGWFHLTIIILKRKFLFKFIIAN